MAVSSMTQSNYFFFFIPVHLFHPSFFILMNNNRIIAWQENEAIKYDHETGQAIGRFVGHTKRVKKGTITFNKDVFFSSSKDSTVRLWDVHNMAKISTISGHSKGIILLFLLSLIRISLSSSFPFLSSYFPFLFLLFSFSFRLLFAFVFFLFLFFFFYSYSL